MVEKCIEQMNAGNEKIKYTAVIRTLGTAGAKYQQLLDSLACQSVQPCEIIVYIAEGYPLPKETIGKERYVYVKKGMVAQRALRYDEVKTEYILFLDDDLYLPDNFIEQCFKYIKLYSLNVIAPDLYYNHKMSSKNKLLNTLLGKAIYCENSEWGYKILRTGGFQYNNPQKNIYLSQTNAGACFICKKEDFLKINFKEELWLDELPYALPDDQVMFYKMYLNGMRIATYFNCGVRHLDAQTSISDERQNKILYSECIGWLVFWYKFIFNKDSIRYKLLDIICILYVMGSHLFYGTYCIFFKFSTRYLFTVLKGYKAGLMLININKRSDDT